MFNKNRKVSTTQMMEERNQLIEDVVSSYIEYKEYLDTSLKKLKEYHISVLANSLQTPTFARKSAIQIQKNRPANEDEKVEHLKDSLTYITNYSAPISNLMVITEELTQKQQNLMGSIAELDHFNNITKFNKKDRKKLKRLVKSFRKFQIRDLTPMDELKAAKEKVKLANDFSENNSIFSHLKHYIQKNDHNEYSLDNLGFYKIDEDYFRKNGIDLYLNVSRKLKENKQSLKKGVKSNITENQFRRYLTY
ncbi:hypothetical protein H6K86_11785 [Staphylococcus epidermidis]|nr:hypothetical protein [Staphylococcus epidermidis]MBM6209941.1 hypothetical protein [Staphylococcus epidermidis]MBM6212289.1 hypothetical protein [Staphylococcus epidermidis]MBM6219248.1 hypothetical protein [Staphylococcus epidermidis]MBM6223770.1 hypothetical protein [Staphylococcus epidermidis]